MSADLPDRYPDLFARPACLSCNYLLTGLPRSGKCPECGHPYDDRSAIVLYARPKPVVEGPPWRTTAFWAAWVIVLMVAELVLRGTLTPGALDQLIGFATIVTIYGTWNALDGARPWLAILSHHGVQTTRNPDSVLAHYPWAKWLAFAAGAIPGLLLRPSEWKPTVLWFGGAAAVMCAVAWLLGWRVRRRHRRWLASAQSDGSPGRAAVMTADGWVAHHWTGAATSRPWADFSAVELKALDAAQMLLVCKLHSFLGWFGRARTTEILLEVPPQQSAGVQACVAEWAEAATRWTARWRELRRSQSLQSSTTRQTPS